MIPLLQQELQDINNIPLAGGIFGAFMGLIFAFLVVFILIAITIYIYTSLAYMAIAKKTKTTPAGIAWIPSIGPAILSAKIAKMHWWPILLLLVVWIPIVGWIAAVVYTVFFIIWSWKVFEAVKRPGWWAILSLIPIVNLVLLGIAAWGK